MTRSNRIDPQPCDVAAIELSGMNLIEASAGTGKTHTIAYLYLRLLIERDLAPGNIAVVTFTEAATKELRDRIRSVLAEALAPHGVDPLRDAILASCRETFGSEAVERRLRRALVRFDEAAIFTIHGFCNRMLADNCFESGRLFDTELITDQQEILQEIIDDFWRITFVRSPLVTAVAAAGGMTLASLHKLAGLLIRSPLVVCEPEADSRGIEHLQAMYERLQALWRRSSDRVGGMLRTFPGFKKAYCGVRLEEILAGAGQALDGLPDAEGLSWLERLTPEALADGMDKRKATAPPAHPLFDLCRDFREARRAALLQLRQRFCAYLRQELPARKRRQNVQCFEDLLLDLLAALRSPDAGVLCASIRRQFKAALIDEFQDTDPVQYEIFMRLFAEADPCSLFLIGDPKQSIYGFRGADIFSYIAAAKRTPPRKRYTLTVNWRSESGYVAAVNRFFADVRNPFAIGGDAVRYIPVVADPASRGNTLPLRIDGKPAAELRLWVAGHDQQQTTPVQGYLKKDSARSLALQATVREISRLLALSAEGRATIGSRPLNPSDIAILVLRNEDARLFIEPLRALQIPAVIARTGSVFHTTEADDVHRLVRAIAAPQRTEYLNAALATPLIGCDAETLRRYREDEAAVPEYEEHRRRFGAFNRLWAEQGFIRMFREALAVYGVRERLLGFPDGERRLTNVLHLGELLHEAAVSQKLGMQGLLALLRRSRTEGGEDEHELRLERDDEAVQILTVFKSKGLQYPIVFCPFMWQRGALDKQDVDPLYHRDGARYLFLDDNDEGLLAARRERLAELMRLLYVALTRAQNRCYLVCGRIAKEIEVTALDYCAAGGEDNPDAVIEATQRAVAGMDGRTMAAALERFADTTLRVEPVTEATFGAAVPYRPGQPTGRITGCREFDASVIDRERGMASFSSLTAARHTAVGDESIVRQDEPSAPAGASAQETAEGFFAFPHGPLPGTCIHAIFERLDFTRAETPDADALIRSLLDRYGLLHCPDPESRVAAVRDMVGRVLDAPLVPLAPACTLRTIAPAQRLAEIAFYYPLRRLTPEFLHNLLSRHAGETVESAAITIGPLAFNPVSGYLQGVMDFVFHHEGRFFLLDWKTNYLGASYEDYAPDRLAVVMRDMHYTLQYLLYTVALDRYLAQRMPGYDYGRHFGGVLYLFVRGMHPDRPGNGIAHALPPHKLIQEIGACTG